MPYQVISGIVPSKYIDEDTGEPDGNRLDLTEMLVEEYDDLGECGAAAFHKFERMGAAYRAATDEQYRTLGIVDAPVQHTLPNTVAEWFLSYQVETMVVWHMLVIREVTL